ncbi:hypothetical protein PG2054B_1603 [Bifidobacterium pseudolongum subsp. pseudolongum]|uniref:Metallo-beta-lactamase domain-containing protein n=1 Tax=Bifidobacterium pseudolongum subsp. pseudolongum TaxID=31954 RepID=A0A4Q5A4E2_9BIFI|nr:hypothetical protein [Bifidobacterium pseudolongum]RYQ18541.1 hypothetical protein PG2054B_1603 [Bifidobacterium pseudolongum subsp. pseudolongum]
MLWEKTFRKSWDDFSPYHRSVGNECALNEFDLSMLRYFFEEHVADDLDFFAYADDVMRQRREERGLGLSGALRNSKFQTAFLACLSMDTAERNRFLESLNERDTEDHNWPGHKVGSPLFKLDSWERILKEYDYVPDVFYGVLVDDDGDEEGYLTFEATDARSKAFWLSPFAIHRFNVYTDRREALFNFSISQEEMQENLIRYRDAPSLYSEGRDGAENRLPFDPFLLRKDCILTLPKDVVQWVRPAPTFELGRWYKILVGPSRRNRIFQNNPSMFAMARFTYMTNWGESRTIERALCAAQQLTADSEERGVEYVHSTDWWKSTPVDSEEAETQLQGIISQIPHIEQIVAFPVGSGTCVGLCGRDGRVKAYCDVGPLTTTKQETRHCVCNNNAPIFLTHWHFDHFGGAITPQEYQGITRELANHRWILPPKPRTAGGPSQRFYKIVQDNCILLTRGTQPLVFPLHDPCQSLTILFGNGRTNDLNNSGIALIMSQNTDDSVERWLMPGDASYNYILHQPAETQDTIPLSEAPYSVVVASHHGGALVPRHTLLPQRNATGGTLLVSFGRKYNHPSERYLRLYTQLGVGAWSMTLPWPTYQNGTQQGNTQEINGDAKATFSKGPHDSPVLYASATWSGHGTIANQHIPGDCPTLQHDYGQQVRML